MKSHSEDIAIKRMVEKILICLPNKFDSIIAVIKEMKGLSTFKVQEVMVSLKSFEQRLSRYSEKPFESVFWSKLNIGADSLSLS